MEIESIVVMIGTTIAGLYLVVSATSSEHLKLPIVIALCSRCSSAADTERLEAKTADLQTQINAMKELETTCSTEEAPAGQEREYREGRVLNRGGRSE